MDYDHKKAVAQVLGVLPDQFVYVRIRRDGNTLVHCKVKRSGGSSKRANEALLRQQFGDHVLIRWTAEDHADVEV